MRDGSTRNNQWSRDTGRRGWLPELLGARPSTVDPMQAKPDGGPTAESEVWLGWVTHCWDTQSCGPLEERQDRRVKKKAQWSTYRV